MNANEQLIQHFYTCFKNGDFKGMQACYADNATFNDEAFNKLNAAEVKAMWQMLISSAKDMQISFSQIKATDNGATAHWEASYTFSATGRKVLNKIDATFVIEDGKIVAHYDEFNFYTWAKQAFGLTGLILGWTSFFKQKVSDGAMQKLTAYMLKAKQHER